MGRASRYILVLALGSTVFLFPVSARETIRVASVHSRMLEPGYGYVRLKQFSENSDRDMETALDRLEKESPGGHLRGLVLDLRNNPGGVLESAVVR